MNCQPMEESKFWKVSPDLVPMDGKKLFLVNAPAILSQEVGLFFDLCKSKPKSNTQLHVYITSKSSLNKRVMKLMSIKEITDALPLLTTCNTNSMILQQVTQNRTYVMVLMLLK